MIHQWLVKFSHGRSHAKWVKDVVLHVVQEAFTRGPLYHCTDQGPAMRGIVEFLTYSIGSMALSKYMQAYILLPSDLTSHCYYSNAGNSDTSKSIHCVQHEP